MSATHILNSSGRIACGREIVRGYISRDYYTQLASTGKMRERTKMSVAHSCKKRPCDCPRRRETISGVCQDCRWRMDHGAD